MYLHLGQDVIVHGDEIIGVFDLDTSTVAESTRDFLTISERNKNVINVTSNLPKSFILCDKGKNYNNKNYAVYISQISPQTLLKRSKESLSIDDND